MKPSHIANVSLGLVLFGWALCIFGALSQLGDPSPIVPRSQIEAQRHISIALLGLGIAALLSAIWLSGYIFKVAKVRAFLALAFCIVPFFVIYAITFFSHHSL
jgi:hypothetical protein